MDHKFKSKWESDTLIFDKDYAGYDDGYSWRQRNFMCNFCKKEYKSAQALGGHMNVHRRDRAKLRLSSPSPLDQPNPNPNPNPSPTFSSSPAPSWLQCLPSYKTFHSSPFSLTASPSSTINKEDKQETIFPFSAPDSLGDVRKNMSMEGYVANLGGGLNEYYVNQQSASRVWKNRDSFRVEMEMGLLKDGKIGTTGLDLELRLGRS